MNIYYLHENPVTAAEMSCYKHVVKMILETAQLLCGAHWVTGSEAPYKLSHKNHPCSIWVRESLSNYLYLCDLGLELCKEYTYRYGRTHKSQQIIEWCLDKKLNIKDKGFTEPPKAMPNECKLESVIDSYRNYYIKEKKSFAKWKNREIPNWFSID